MRPQRLRLAGFGAYPGAEEVDFDELARLGLFVVTGPTGAGKTTLFDAMAFALYGELPGGRPLGEVRSHHAAPADRCEVELTFAIEGVSYRVRRTPEQERPKRRGTGTTVEAATAELHRLDPDGTEVPVASGTRPVTEACVALVGLDAGQFERVVLLPQGRFQAFLLAGTKERRPLLQKLFGTALYRDAVEELKRRAAELRRRVDAVDIEIDHHRLNAKEHLRWVAAGLADDELPALDGVEPDDDLELLEAFWQKLAPGVAEAERRSAQLTEQATAATRAADAAARARRPVGPAGHAARAGPRSSPPPRPRSPAGASWSRPPAGPRRSSPRPRCSTTPAPAWPRPSAPRPVRSARCATHLAAVDLAPPTPTPTSTPTPPTGPSAWPPTTSSGPRARLGELAGARTALGRATAVAHRGRQRQAALVADQERTDELRAELGRPPGRARARSPPRPRRSRPRSSPRPTCSPVVASSTSSAPRSSATGPPTPPPRPAWPRSSPPSSPAPPPAWPPPCAPATSCPVCGSTEHPAPAEPDDDAEIDVPALERAQQRTARAASDLAAGTGAVAEQLDVLGRRRPSSPVAELDAAHQQLLAAEKAAVDAAVELVDVERRLDQGRRAPRGAPGAGHRAGRRARHRRGRGRRGRGQGRRAGRRGRRHRPRAAGRAGATAWPPPAGPSSSAGPPPPAVATATGAVEQADAALADTLATSGFADLAAARSAALAGAGAPPARAARRRPRRRPRRGPGRAGRAGRRRAARRAPRRRRPRRRGRRAPRGRRPGPGPASSACWSAAPRPRRPSATPVASRTPTPACATCASAPSGSPPSPTARARARSASRPGCSPASSSGSPRPPTCTSAA